MKKIDIGNLFERNENSFALVLGIAKRARQIAQEFEEQEIITDDNPVVLAAEEVKSHITTILVK